MTLSISFLALFGKVNVRPKLYVVSKFTRKRKKIVNKNNEMSTTQKEVKEKIVIIIIMCKH